MGKKIIDFVTRRNGSRGRKSKAGGGIKSKAAQLYTPLEKLCVCVCAKEKVYVDGNGEECNLVCAVKGSWDGRVWPSVVRGVGGSGEKGVVMYDGMRM